MTSDGVRRASVVALLAAAGVLVLLVGLSEWRTAAERGRAGEGPVAVDVEAARTELANRLLALEEACADTAEEALERTAQRVEPVAIFEALHAVPLPAGAGAHVEDRLGRILAWAGTTLDDTVARAIPRDGDGGRLFDTPNGRRISVRRTRSSPVEEEPVIALCHMPVEQLFPQRTRFLTSFSLGDEIADGYRVGAVRILPPEAGVGIVLPSMFGGDLVSVDVEPLSPTAWRERVSQRADESRALLLLLLTLVLTLLAWWRAPAVAHRWSGSSHAGHLARGVVVVAARVALAFVSLRDVFPGGSMTSAGTFNASWPLGLGATPLDVLLTCLAALGVILALRGAAEAGRRRPLPAPVFIGIVVVAAIAARIVLGALISEVALTARVQVFVPEQILPGAAGAALFGGFVVAGSAAVILMESLWRHFAPDSLAGPQYRLLACVLGAALLSPVSYSDARFQWLLVVIGMLGFGAALAATAFGRGAAARAAAIPLGVAIGVFAPAQLGLLASAQADVEDLVQMRDEGGVDEETRIARLRVKSLLTELTESERLQAGLARRNTPPDLAATLWKHSRLAELHYGSSLSVGPLDPQAGHISPVGFSAGLPPTQWLPDPGAFPGNRELWVHEYNEGRGAGRGGRWVVGETPIAVDGTEVAYVRVILQVRPPSVQEVPRLASVEEMKTHPETARLPPMDLYDYEGKLEVIDNPRRPGGPRLDDEARADVLEEGRSLWRSDTVAGENIDVLIHPRRDESGNVIGAYAAAFEGSSGRRLVLNATKASLFGALLSLLALVVSAPWWARGAKLRFSYRLVISYALVAALPLLVLAWVNRELVRGREATARQDAVRELVSALAATLHADDVPERLARLQPGDLEVGSGATDALKSELYSPGYPQGLYLDASLGLVTDHGLLDTPVMPPRMDGKAYLEVNLLERPFHVSSVAAERDAVDVGFAPLRGPNGDVIGALSVPVIREAWRREKEEVDSITTVAGFYLFSLVTVMLIGALLARRLAAPLRALRDGTRRVAHGDLSVPVPPRGSGEMTQVIEAFNGMMSDLAESREKLVRAEKEAAWRDMARQVAHEVKNPLTPMRLAAEHLRRAHEDNHPEFDSVLRRAVDVIIRQTETLRRIVTDFRDFARMPVQRRDPVDLGGLVRDVLALYRDMPNVTVQIDVARGVPAVLADPDELRRVIVNIAGNSVESFDGRDGTVTARVTADGEHVVATLVDDGPGIPDKILPRLFEPSFSTKTGGTGLGLAICKRAVEDLGGTIAIESARGSGTRVTIRIPRAPTQGAVTPPPSTLG